MNIMDLWPFRVFKCGCTEWSSNGETHSYRFCFSLDSEDLKLFY